MTLNNFYGFFALILIVMLTAMFNTANAADTTKVFKWTDVDGQVHYGHRTSNKNAKEIEIIIKKDLIQPEENDESLTTEERVNNQKRFLDAMDEENKSIAEEKRKKNEQEEAMLTRCNASRDQLKRYENSGALYDLDEKGNRILLNKKQYELAMQQARARVEKWCN